ncbi:hypothetical protein [Streptomyces omiyaensis]|uniref:Uncharacterized protein n=1 Tax=Streptomyces omiyaensis TaxID=68247 RepID=A0ABW7C1U3_9ACTN
MIAFRRYFEDNPEIFAALVAAIAIVGGIVGSIIGAKIQANGGRDQAAAAREAAKTAAEAQRVAALWTVRQVQVAELIQAVREVRRVSELFYEQNAATEGIEGQLREAQQAVSRKLAEIELIVPFAVVCAAEKSINALGRLAEIAKISGPQRYFLGLLVDRAYGRDPAQSALAHQALDAFEELNTAARADNPGSTDDERATMFQNAVRTLRAATGATTEQAVAAAGYVNAPGMSTREIEIRDEFSERMKELVGAAREMLRSEDDVAPAAPEQRRRWWRAA